MDTAIGIFTIVLGVAAATIPSYYKVRVPNGSRKITKAGILVVVLVTALVVLQGYQIWRTEDEKVKTVRAANLRDSLTKDFIVKNNESIITPFAKELERTGKKYDLAKREIKNIVRDSSKHVSITSEVIPELTIETLVLDTATRKLETRYEVTQAAAYDIEIRSFCVIRTIEDRLEFSGPIHEKMRLEKLTAGSGVSRYSTSDNLIGVKRIYVMAFGSYSDVSRKTKHPFNEIKFYDLQREHWGLLSEKEDIWVRDFFNKNIKN